MKKFLSLLLACALLGLSAAALAEDAASVPAFEDIVFPETMPTGYYKDAQSLDYSYDDMTETYEVEIVSQGYGVPHLPNDEDPILQYLNNAFNLDITFTVVNAEDLETHLSTRIAAGDYPDVFVLPSREFAFQLSDAGLLIDARELYPYLPLHQKYVTQGMIDFSTNASNDEIAFVTKYGIQDGIWAAAIRTDWLEAFGMEMPTTREEIIEYAKACTFNDPDGNGQDDTWFMTAAGGGNGLGMLDNIFGTMAGSNQAYVDENGELSHPYFNGVRKEFLTFCKELYDLGVLAPDWYTIDWETAKSYTLNDKIGLLYYPAGSLYTEYTMAQGNSNEETMAVWKFLEQYPIEGGKYSAAGNPGYMWAFSAPCFEGQEGKLLRVLHMIDTMCVGGENFSHTAQGADDIVYDQFGIERIGSQEFIYTDDGMFYIRQTNLDENGGEQFPYDQGSYGGLALASWQNFGLNVSWQLSDPDTGDPVIDNANAITNEAIKAIAAVDRWPNYGLNVTLTGDAAEASITLGDWINATEFEFVTGARSLDEYEDFANEWLSRGGQAIIEQTAECLGCEVPEYAQ